MCFPRFLSVIQLLNMIGIISLSNGKVLLKKEIIATVTWLDNTLMSDKTKHFIVNGPHEIPGDQGCSRPSSNGAL